MSSMMGQRGFYPNHYNRFSPTQRPGTNPVPGPRPASPSPVNPQIPTTTSQPTQPIIEPITQPTAQPTSIQEQLNSLFRTPSSTSPESSNIWQQQAGILIKKYRSLSRTTIWPFSSSQSRHPSRPAPWSSPSSESGYSARPTCWLSSGSQNISSARETSRICAHSTFGTSILKKKSC